MSACSLAQRLRWCQSKYLFADILASALPVQSKNTQALQMPKWVMLFLLQVQIALSSLSTSLQAAKGRLDALEQMRIPTLEERVQEVSRTSAQVCLCAPDVLPI